MIQSNGFLIHDFDKCDYLKYFNGAYVMICLYVDDILIFRTILAIIKEKILCYNFDMKDLGPIGAILGIKLIKFDNEFILIESHYVKKLLKKFNYYILDIC